MQNGTIITKAKSENNNSFVGLENRKKISLTGVSEVISTNDSNITGKLAGTKFYVNGKNIQITKLDIEQGIVEATGTIDSIKFGQTSSLIKRIFQ